MQIENKHSANISTASFLAFALLNTLVVFLGIADYVFFDHQLSDIAARYINPDLYFVFIGFPHIIASFFTMFHQNYFTSYKTVFLKKIIPVLLVACTLIFINFNLYKLLFIFLLSIHVAGQATGISRYFGIENGKSFLIWKSINCTLLLFSFLIMYNKEFLLLLPISFSSLKLLIMFIFLMTNFAVIPVVMRTTTVKGKLYLLLIQFQLAGICYFSVVESLLYWGIMITFFHDVIAFIFYVNHERNAESAGNLNFLIGNKFLPIGIVVILISIVVAAGLAHFLTLFSIPFVMFLFQIAHYLLEGDIWLSGSLHRKYITMKHYV